MSLDSHLIHLCTIERKYQDVNNTHGLASDRYMVIAESQACRLVVDLERVAVTERAAGPVVTGYTLLLPDNADIAKKDHVTAIALEDGTVMRDGFVVEAILPRRGKSLRHVSVRLTRIT